MIMNNIIRIKLTSLDIKKDKYYRTYGVASGDDNY